MDYLELYKESKRKHLDGCPLATAILRKQSKCGKKCPFGKCIYDLIDENNEVLMATIYGAIERVKGEI